MRNEVLKASNHVPEATDSEEDGYASYIVEDEKYKFKWFLL